MKRKLSTNAQLFVGFWLNSFNCHFGKDNFTDMAKKILKTVENILKKALLNLLPPIIWSSLRFLFRRRRKNISYSDYQGVKIPFEMTRLTTGEFSSIHSKWASLDEHLNGDVQKTRLRVYYVLSFAELALQNTRSGCYMAAGISYGTASLVTAEMLKFGHLGRYAYMVDPFMGTMNSNSKNPTLNFNTDLQIVKERWPNNISTTWIEEYLSVELLENLPRFFFVHLNTSDFDAELKCLPVIFEKLEPGGVIVCDLYGWQDKEKQTLIDKALLRIGAKSFQLPTRQLIIYKATA